MTMPHIALMGWGHFRLSAAACLLAVIAAVPVADAIAQETASQPESVLAAGELQVPALTPIEIAVDAELGSKISTSGQMFPLHLASAIIVDGKEIVPAGTQGQGEVVHAKKAGGSGAPGELVLAARYLQIGERRLKLRSMRIGQVGKDAVNGVTAFNAVAAATLPPVSIIGFAVTGRNVIYPAGTVAAAKTAETFAVNSSPTKQDAAQEKTGAADLAPSHDLTGKISGQ